MYGLGVMITQASILGNIVQQLVIFTRSLFRLIKHAKIHKAWKKKTNFILQNCVLQTMMDD